MSYEPAEASFPPQREPRSWMWLLNLGLFILTLFTTTIAGVLWINRNPFELGNFSSGLPYSLSLLFVLGSHEFGHYFAARYHNVKTTLPFFIPWPPFIFSLFGTLGAVIRTRMVPTKKAMFDIGAAGPIAGFVACLMVLSYGFLNLPGPDYILSMHPNYDFRTNSVPDPGSFSLTFGNSILFAALQSALAGSHTFVPPMSEIYHYPFLCVGWFGLFVTAMNLIPVGQLDGGHIIYTMFGDNHRKVARGAFIGLMIFGLPSFADWAIRKVLEFFLHEQYAQVIPFAEYSWGGWLLWAAICFTIIKLYHPPVADETPLDEKRMIVGWLCLVMFVVCFAPVPFDIAG